jgi:hypothetical protein
MKSGHPVRSQFPPHRSPFGGIVIDQRMICTNLSVGNDIGELCKTANFSMIGNDPGDADLKITSNICGK